jgi:hypothetical protein
MYKSVFDGQITADWFPPANVNHPVGTVYDSTVYKELLSTAIRPILLVYRPLAPEMLNIDLAQFSVLPQEARVDGADCVVLREDPRPGQATQTHLYLDPARDFIPLRLTETVRQKPTFQIDIRFATDPVVGFAPAGWTILYLDDAGGIKTSQVATVTSLATNEAIADDRFTIDFPPGTWVRDLRAKAQYIVREDLSRRPITPQEREAGATYEQLVSTSPPGMTRWWLLSMNVVLVAILLFVLLARRMRQASC